jgi:hypothetical protein
LDDADVKMTCNDCYLYAGGGIGFEFETSLADLVYMKIWLETEYSMSMNVNINAKGQAPGTSNSSNSSGTSSEPTRNYWTQEKKRDVKIDQISPAKFSNTKKLLNKDIVFTVSSCKLKCLAFLHVDLHSHALLVSVRACLSR